MTDNNLSEVYRKAAELIEKHGKYDGSYGNPDCGFCTMGAVLHAATGGNPYSVPEVLPDGTGNPEFVRLMKPVSDRIVKSGRSTLQNEREGEWSTYYATVYRWNDGTLVKGPGPSAEDVATLLRETAAAVEAKGASV